MSEFNPIDGAYSADDLRQAMLALGFGSELVEQIASGLGSGPVETPIISAELKDFGLAPASVEAIVEKLEEGGGIVSEPSFALEGLPGVNTEVFNASTGMPFHMTKGDEASKLAAQAGPGRVFYYKGRKLQTRKRDA